MKKTTLWLIEWRTGNKLHNDIFEGDQAAEIAKKWIVDNGWKVYSINCL